jgi:hypothetical protein
MNFNDIPTGTRPIYLTTLFFSLWPKNVQVGSGSGINWHPSRIRIHNFGLRTRGFRSRLVRNISGSIIKTRRQLKHKTDSMFHSSAWKSFVCFLSWKRKQKQKKKLNSTAGFCYKKRRHGQGCRRVGGGGVIWNVPYSFLGPGNLGYSRALEFSQHQISGRCNVKTQEGETVQFKENTSRALSRTGKNGRTCYVWHWNDADDTSWYENSQ